MPRFLVPHKSGLHRIASIALYRALLSQCKNLKLPAPRCDEIQNIIRNRFREQRHVTSHRQLHVSFTAGYEAIDHLDAAVAGNQQSHDYILDLASRAPAKAKLPPPKRPSTAERAKEARKRKWQERQALAPNPIKLEDRPLPLERLSGKTRRVPVLFSANLIPVLRLKKPQPHSLSMYIRGRIEQRQRRLDRRDALTATLALAKREDQWDRVLRDVGGVREGGGSWTQVPRDGLREVAEAFERERRKNQAWAEKLQGVVDREREAWERERAEKKERRRRKTQDAKKDVAPSEKAGTSGDAG